MANASAKRIASQNETALQNLFYGQTASVVLAFILRLLFGTLLKTKKGMFFYTTTGVGSQYLYTRLKSMGTPKRDASGSMISPGEDLTQPGVTEWMFDVLYISWAAQVGSALLGEWLWWLYAVIPAFVIYKFWGFIGPMLGFGRSSSNAEEAPAAPESLSKRQEKLKKRSERGDPRVKMQTRR